MPGLRFRSSCIDIHSGPVLAPATPSGRLVGRVAKEALNSPGGSPSRARQRRPPPRQPPPPPPRKPPPPPPWKPPPGELCQPPPMDGGGGCQPPPPDEGAPCQPPPEGGA